MSSFLLFIGSLMVALFHWVYNSGPDNSDDSNDSGGGNEPETPEDGQGPSINIDFTEQKSHVFVDIRGNLVDNSEREKVTA